MAIFTDVHASIHAVVGMAITAAVGLAINAALGIAITAAVGVAILSTNDGAASNPVFGYVNGKG